jgi:hypothetical protein
MGRHGVFGSVNHLGAGQRCRCGLGPSLTHTSVGRGHVRQPTCSKGCLRACASLLKNLLGPHSRQANATASNSACQHTRIHPPHPLASVEDRADDCVALTIRRHDTHSRASMRIVATCSRSPSATRDAWGAVMPQCHMATKSERTSSEL